MLVCVDGLTSYVTVFLRVFREPVATGRRGRPRLVLAAGFQLAQVVKQSAKRRVVGVPAGWSKARRRASRRCWRPRGPARDPYRLHRAAQRHLSRVPGAPGAPRPGHRAARGASGGDVSGGRRLQLLLGAWQPSPARPGRLAPQVARAHPGDGRWAHRPLLDVCEPAPLPDAPTQLGRAETPGPTTQTPASQGCRMTTVKWGATTCCAYPTPCSTSRSVVGATPGAPLSPIGTEHVWCRGPSRAGGTDSRRAGW